MIKISSSKTTDNHELLQTSRIPIAVVDALTNDKAPVPESFSYIGIEKIVDVFASFNPPIVHINLQTLLAFDNSATKKNQLYFTHSSKFLDENKPLKLSRWKKRTFPTDTGQEKHTRSGCPYDFRCCLICCAPSFNYPPIVHVLVRPFQPHLPMSVAPSQ